MKKLCIIPANSSEFTAITEVLPHSLKIEVLTKILSRYSNFDQVLVVLSEVLRNELEGEKFDKNSKLVFLKQKTRGALATLGMSLNDIPNSQPFLIAPINAVLKIDIVQFYEIFSMRKNEVGLLVMDSINPSMSYIRKFNNQVVEIVEKEVVSEIANCGFYYFRSKDVLIQSMSWAMVNNLSNEKNFYIAPAINYLIAQGGFISDVKIDAKDYVRLKSPQDYKMLKL